MNSAVDGLGSFVTDFGWPGGLLLLTILGFVQVMRWLKPLGEEWFSEQRHTMRALQDSVTGVKDVFNEVGIALRELVHVHEDPSSAVSTVRTNRAILLLGKMLAEIAAKQGIDVSDPYIRLQEVLAHDPLGQTVRPSQPWDSSSS